jgi:hypothetical protein
MLGECLTAGLSSAFKRSSQSQFLIIILSIFSRLCESSVLVNENSSFEFSSPGLVTCYSSFSGKTIPASVLSVDVQNQTLLQAFVAGNIRSFFNSTDFDSIALEYTRIDTFYLLTDLSSFAALNNLSSLILYFRSSVLTESDMGFHALFHWGKYICPTPVFYIPKEAFDQIISLTPYSELPILELQLSANLEEGYIQGPSFICLISSPSLIISGFLLLDCFVKLVSFILEPSSFRLGIGMLVLLVNLVQAMIGWTFILSTQLISPFLNFSALQAILATGIVLGVICQQVVASAFHNAISKVVPSENKTHVKIIAVLLTSGAVVAYLCWISSVFISVLRSSIAFTITVISAIIWRVVVCFYYIYAHFSLMRLAKQ